MDLRIRKLAKVLVSYSCNIGADENVLIDLRGTNTEMATALVEEVYKAGAIPFVNVRDTRVFRSLLLNCNEEQIKSMARYDLHRAKEMDAYIVIVTSENAAELSDVPREKFDLYSKFYGRPIVSDILTQNSKWVLVNFPSHSLAQKANMSSENFENFLFDVCTLDYSKMSNSMDSLVKLMQRTKKVRITSPGTDISFSIEGMPVIKCDGKYNVPDGEVFTAPIKDSIEGYITYNTPSEYQGKTYNNIKFIFSSGKIIEATSNNTEALNELLNCDEGARYIGEFAIGLNPFILNPMTDILFDEKIAGSFHLTPGRAYADCDNGNKSTIHWDLVCIQRAEYGGGEIYFDDVLIRKDGIFVVPDLYCLNPDNLK